MQYFKSEPLYPFGHGLSYTNFQYANLKIKQTKPNELLVSVTVKNTGNNDGGEVAQLYLSNKKTTFKSPIIALKGFEKIYLKAESSKLIVFKLHQRELSEINEKGKNPSIKQTFELILGGTLPSENNVLQ